MIALPCSAPLDNNPIAADMKEAMDCLLVDVTSDAATTAFLRRKVNGNAEVCPMHCIYTAALLNFVRRLFDPVIDTVQCQCAAA